MKLGFVNRSSHRIPRQFLLAKSRQIKTRLQRAGVENSELLKKEMMVVFLSEKEMKEVNRRFRSKNSVTDVLSFESMDPDSLGELLFSPDQIQRQSVEQGHAFRDELLYMFLHGILHLLGYDHETPKEAKQMFELQDSIYEILQK